VYNSSPCTDCANLKLNFVCVLPLCKLHKAIFWWKLKRDDWPLFCDVLFSCGDSLVKSSQIVHCHLTAGALSLLLNTRNCFSKDKIASQTAGVHAVQTDRQKCVENGCFEMELYCCSL
jgi:hypothetical protein